MSSAPSVTEVPTGATATSCPVCPHAQADHDRISLRFCAATQARPADADAAQRCVCPT
jgi:hypothetical protein